MIEIFDGHDKSIDDNNFTSVKKNLGNKMFIYSCSRLLSDILDCDLKSPEKALIGRNLNSTGEFLYSFFPFHSVIKGKKLDEPFYILDDHHMIQYETLDNVVKHMGSNAILICTYFSKYDYIKPYKNKVKEYYKDLVLPKRNDNSMILMLRDSNKDKSFKLPYQYYIDILKKENFSKLYVSLDHLENHQYFLNKIKKYKPEILDGDILSLFKTITSFDKIIACQGTFSFWASFLSNADIIYWPITEDGPNAGIFSKSPVIKNYVNLLVDDESRYKHIYI